MATTSLHEKHRQLCNDALRELAACDEKIAGCKECGMDMSDREQTASDLRKFAESVKRRYFQGEPG